MNLYSTKEYTYKNKPVLEILIDGEPFGKIFPYDEHFRFGLKKAKMILTCIDIIKRFFENRGSSPDANRPFPRRNNEYDLDCTCIKYNEFDYYGETKPQPYLELTAGDTKFGFGLTKAEAILKVKDDIEQFVELHKVI